MKIRFLFAHASACLVLAVIAAGIVSAGAGMAQEPPAATGTAPVLRDIVGIWQGTLHIAAANRDLRIECKISKDDKGELKVTDYGSINRAPYSRRTRPPSKMGC